MGFLVLFGNEDADVATIAEAANQGFVGEFVELLHLFALDVDATGGAHDFEQAGALDIGGDDFRGEGDAGEEPTEFLGGVRIGPLMLEEMALDRGHQGFERHGESHSYGVSAGSERSPVCDLGKSSMVVPLTNFHPPARPTRTVTAKILIGKTPNWFKK